MRHYMNRSSIRNVNKTIQRVDSADQVEVGASHQEQAAGRARRKAAADLDIDEALL